MQQKDRGPTLVRHDVHAGVLKLVVFVIAIAFVVIESSSASIPCDGPDQFLFVFFQDQLFKRLGLEGNVSAVSGLSFSPEGGNLDAEFSGGGPLLGSQAPRAGAKRLGCLGHSQQELSPDPRREGKSYKHGPGHPQLVPIGGLGRRRREMVAAFCRLLMLAVIPQFGVLKFLGQDAGPKGDGNSSPLGRIEELDGLFDRVARGVPAAGGGR